MRLGRARRNKKCRSAEQERHSTAEAAGEGHWRLRGGLWNPPGHGLFEDGHITGFHHWGSGCMTLKLDYKVSSPLSHELTEIQPEGDLYLAAGQQASESQTCELLTKLGEGGAWVLRGVIPLLLILLTSFPISGTYSGYFKYKRTCHLRKFWDFFFFFFFFFFFSEKNVSFLHFFTS